jgi:hypothetical protein
MLQVLSVLLLIGSIAAVIVFGAKLGGVAYPILLVLTPVLFAVLKRLGLTADTAERSAQTASVIESTVKSADANSPDRHSTGPP